jgi:acid phosphatase
VHRKQNKRHIRPFLVEKSLVSAFVACAAALLFFASGCLYRTRINPNSTQPEGPASAAPSHFDRVLIIVLENQKQDDVMRDPFFRSLAGTGANFTNFHALFHPSYPNYLAMIGGKDYEVHLLNSDRQINFPDDPQHRTIADLLGDGQWKNYAENYPTGSKPFQVVRRGRYARKHVPFASFRRIQNDPKAAANIVRVDPAAADNEFTQDVKNHALPRYAFYSPNLDNDGHDPRNKPREGLKKASHWLKDFLENKISPGDPRKGLLIIVTFDESLNRDKDNWIYTVFLGDMVKPGEYSGYYTHYNVLRTIEDNFHLDHDLGTGDLRARSIQDIWK